MKFTVPVYIALDAPTAHTARVLILGMLASEKILRISYTVCPAVDERRWLEHIEQQLRRDFDLAKEQKP